MKRKIITAAILVSAVALFAQVAGWNPITQNTWFQGRVAIGDSLTANSGIRGTKGAQFDSLALGNPLPIGYGGTQATSAGAARTALGLAIGTDVQAYDADLTDLADGSLTGSKVGSGISGTNVTTGTVDDARIDGANLAGNQISWDAGNTEYDVTEGSGSGLDADTIDGVDESARDDPQVAP